MLVIDGMNHDLHDFNQNIKLAKLILINIDGQKTALITKKTR